MIAEAKKKAHANDRRKVRYSMNAKTIRGLIDSNTLIKILLADWDDFKEELEKLSEADKIAIRDHFNCCIPN